MRDDDLVELSRPQTIQEAYLLKRFLETYGIEVVIEGEHLNMLMGAVPVFEAYPAICVHEADADEAEQLMLEFQQAGEAPDASEDA